jgi:PAS domain S-box-containing protein
MSDLTPDAESLYRTIFESAGVGISLVDADGRLLECNPAMIKLFGYSAEEFRRMNIRDLTHPDDMDPCAEKFAGLMAGCYNSYQVEKRCLRRDGQVIWGNLIVSVIPETTGGPLFAMGIVEDITERKRTEEALRASREHLEASVRASNTGFWDWNLKTNEVYYSPEWKSQLGYQDHEIFNGLEEWQNRLHPEDRQPAIAKVLAFLKHPRPNFDTEFRLRHRDSSYRWMLSRASVVLGPDGSPARMLGCHLDITERKQVVDRLREYEKVVEGLQEMIAVVDRDYLYLIANRAFLKYRELEKEQLIGQSLPDIMDRTVFETTIKPKLDECFEGRVVKYESPHTYPKLGERYLSISYLPIEGPLGIDRAACVMEDITERRQAEEEVHKAHQQLTVELRERTQAEQRVRALSDRLITAQEEERRNIARELHDDLSQQIAALSISVSNLKRNMASDAHELRAQSDEIHQRINRLSEGVRHLARRLHPAVLEYSGIAAALQSYGIEFSAVNRIEVTVEASGSFEDVPGPVGLCLYRVAQEALQNVSKHSQAAAATVRIERREGCISLVVQDSGRGFPDTRSGSDRGLGLVSMSERVRLVNGALNIESTPGEGTTVTVSIPLVG